MAPVRWADLSEKQYEDMVSVLLSHLHPDATRVDGSGGDGGRDVQIVRHDGLSAFELKSFTGRMTTARRRQVKSSLRTASGLNPRDWTLIVPIDLTPGELAWFDGLRRTVPFPIDHQGKTWLDAQLAPRPCIVRYFLEDAANEVARLAEVLRQEEAVLAGGAPDALERVARVVDQLNGLDPHYRFEVTVGEGTRSVRIIPRYRGAEADRPVTVGVTFRFPADESGRAAAEDVRRAIDFGTGMRVPPEYVQELRVDAPAQLGGTYEHAELVIGPSTPTPVSRTLVLVCESEGGVTLADLPVEVTLASQGRSGMVWRGGDRSGRMSVALTVDGRARSYRFDFHIGAFESYLPAELWPLVRFLSALHKPNRLVLIMGGERFGQPTEGPDEPLAHPFMETLVEALVLIQLAAHRPGPVPTDLPEEEIEKILTTARLLRGDTVLGSWDKLTMELSDSAPLDVRTKLVTDESEVALVASETYTVAVGGTQYSLGKHARVVYERARLGGPVRTLPDGTSVADPVPDTWTSAGAVPAGAAIALVPGSTDACRLSLVTLDEERPERAAGP